MNERLSAIYKTFEGKITYKIEHLQDRKDCQQVEIKGNTKDDEILSVFVQSATSSTANS